MLSKKGDVVDLLSNVEEMEEKTTLCDIYRVLHPSGLGTHALYVKHVGSIGCPPWNAPATIPEDVDQGRLELVVAATIVLAGDSGPDEVVARSMMIEETMSADVQATDVAKAAGFSLVVFAFSLKCWMHQYHLIVQKSLATADLVLEDMQGFQNSKRTYFSTLAKILHCWRDNAIKFHSAWKQHYTPTDARLYGSTRPKLALVGRWGAVDDGEAHVLRPPIQQLRTVVQEVLPLPAALVSRANAAGAIADATPLKPLEDAKSTSRPPKSQEDAKGTEELALAETQAHVAKMSRWKKDSALAIYDPIFLPVIVEIMHRARQPLLEWFNWMKEESGTPQRVVIDDTSRVVGKLALMVWSKVA